MHRVLAMCFVSVAALAAPPVAIAQDEGFQQVIRESARLRQIPAPSNEMFWDKLKEIRQRSDGLHAALRDWMESLLPKSRAALDIELPHVDAKIGADLRRPGLFNPTPNDEDGNIGLPDGVKFTRPSEAPDMLLATWSVGVPCGVYDVVYAYDYSTGFPRRILESHGSDGGEMVSQILVSKPNVYGSRLILTLRYAVQCGSFWNQLSYDLFRFSTTADLAAPLLSAREINKDWDYEVRLDPTELLIELEGRMMDASILVRKHVLHFNLAGSDVQRIDPVALQPQDFVDEWLTRPWPEMESRSGHLKKWHDFLAVSGDQYLAGELAFVQPCKDTPDESQIGVNLGYLKGEELPEPLTVYFLVQQSGEYRFKMMGISFDRQDGCPGETRPSDARPSLFPPKEQK